MFVATDFECTGFYFPLQWRHSERDGVSNHQPQDCLFDRLFRHRSKKTLKLRVTGLCEENSPVTGEFPAQRASNAGNVSNWWRHRVKYALWSSYWVSILSCINRSQCSSTLNQVSWCPFHWHGLIIISNPAWISNYILSEVCDKFTFPFIPQFTGHVIT